jgi:hypothetical protein
MPMFQLRYWKEAQTIRQHMQQLDCRCNVREMLKTHPFALVPLIWRVKDWK